MATDIEIARRVQLKPIVEVAERKLGVPTDQLLLYGPYKAKLKLDLLRSLENKPKKGKLILVTAINPTPAGEGKTTTTIGLGDALNRLGRKAIICLREPSLGPCFGIKGGATGGGYAQVAPMEEINLHFTGDFHAIAAAHNLLAAAVDNHIHHGNELDLDVRRITWKRVVDMNDRALRNVIVGLGGPAHGVPRESGFDIVVASEVMAILCLSRSLPELRERLGRILIGYSRSGEACFAESLRVHGAMAALLRDAFLPNLVQTLEHNPAFIHGGPFANIAHGCNSLIATDTALKLADFVVTEAGFGADLGAEKFIDIKCRRGKLFPSVVVLVATVRALKMHGGASRERLSEEDLGALEKGFANLERHYRNLTKNFGLPVVIAINRFLSDTERELTWLQRRVAEIGGKAFICTHWKEGSRGATALAEEVVRLSEEEHGHFRFLYSDDMPLWNKIETIAKKIYCASAVVAEEGVKREISELDRQYRHYPICIAKTQYSFSANPTLLGAPEDHVLPVRRVVPCHGAEFLVVLCGDTLTMPGLPRKPAAEAIDIDSEGNIVGLF